MVLPYKGVFYEMNCLFTSQGILTEGRKYPCADFEINAAECFEAYGVVKGAEKCLKFVEDFKECRFLMMTAARYTIMRQERYKKIAKGEIPFSKRWGADYPYDSFVPGGLNP